MIDIEAQPLPSGCWAWTGRHRKEDGRPMLGTRYVYRLTYERDRGPIPPGLVLDHLCKNPSCINPGHLEAVPQATNMARAGVVGGDISGQGLKTHCPAGHEYTPENTYRWHNERQCRQCRLAAKRRYNAKHCRAGRLG